jgi:ATP/maltotriose-dependent transcriptional regulator MalT
MGALAPAIDHALAAGAFERAAELIQRFAEIGTGVRPWLDQLPDEVISLYPALRTLPEPYPANIEPLSEREVEVLHLISHGMSNPEIARRLIIAVSTVKTHVKNIYRKLDVDTRYEAMQRARELDLLRIRLEGEYRRLIK